MSTVSARFALKEKRKGKITKNGLTWLTSTPSNPYRSKAEACQPEPVIFAAWQGRGNDLSPRTPASGTGVGRGSAPLIFRNAPIREEEEFLFSSFYRGRWGGCLASATSPIAPAALPPDLAMAAQTARRG